MKKRKTLLAVITLFLGCSLMFGGGTALADTYEVKAGDTLYSIANKHKLTVEELKTTNCLHSYDLWVGQKLQVPDQNVQAANNSGVHRVVAGDSLYQISKRYNCTVDELKRWNNLKGDVIFVGQKLKISGNTAAQSSNAAVTTTATAVTTETATQNRLEQTSLHATSSRGGAYRRSYTQEDWDMLAKVVFGEARGESYEGQVAVAAVVLNRVEHQDFPDTIADVVFQQNAFTCVNDGQYDLLPNRTAYEAAMEAMQGVDPTNGCLYYWNPVTATSPWIWTRTILLQLGNHVFGV